MDFSRRSPLVWMVLAAALIGCDAQEQEGAVSDAAVGDVVVRDAPVDHTGGTGGGDAGRDAVFDTGVGGDGGPPVDLWLDLGHGVTVLPANPLAGDSLQVAYDGVLTTGGNVHVRYGFNGWNEVSGVELASIDDGTGNLDFYREATLSPELGGFRTTLPVPAEARAVHMVFFSEQGEERTWDNHEGLDYNVGIPFMVYGPLLTWDGSVQAEAGVVVSFHTGWPCVGVAEYGVGNFSQSAQEPAPTRSHRIRLGGLPPDTRVDYRLRCDGMQSEAYSFRTAPTGPAPFEFLLISDLQDNGESERLARTVDAIVTYHPDAAFVVVVGDTPWMDRPGLWWTSLDRIRPLLARMAIVPVPGNHDQANGVTTPGQTRFEWMYNLDPSSGSETYNLVRYGSAAILGFNSNRGADFAAGEGAQYLWAEERMQDPLVTNATWVFAAWHCGPYNAGARHWAEQGTFREVTSLFGGKVDWVFGGHEHLYQRFLPLQFSGVLAPGDYGRGAEDGVGYLLTPPAGAYPEHGVIPLSEEKGYYRYRLAYPVVPDDTDTAPSSNGFVSVGLEGSTIHIRSWSVGEDPSTPPQLVDETSYSK